MKFIEDYKEVPISYVTHEIKLNGKYYNLRDIYYIMDDASTGFPVEVPDEFIDLMIFFESNDILKLRNTFDYKYFLKPINTTNFDIFFNEISNLMIENNI